MRDSSSSTLRRLLEAPGITVAPGVTNAFDAKLAEKAGFPVVFTTGAGIANRFLGVPDLGLATMTEVMAVTRRVVDAVDVPVIADMDTGYGNHLNVVRTTQEAEHAGVGAFIIEDQVFPKRCGHFEGKAVEPVEVMVQKVVAARDARRDGDLVLIARTDALSTEGLEGALRRARAYLEAGADVIFVEAPNTEEELAAIPRELGVPCLVNMVEGGKTPLLDASELERMGYSLVVYANLALRASARAVEEAFAVLHRDGTSREVADTIFSWEERQGLVGLDEWLSLDERIAQEAADTMSGRSTAAG